MLAGREGPFRKRYRNRKQQGGVDYVLPNGYNGDRGVEDDVLPVNGQCNFDVIADPSVRPSVLPCPAHVENYEEEERARFRRRCDRSRPFLSPTPAFLTVCPPSARRHK